MEITVEDVLKTNGFIIVAADYQSNHYKVKFDDDIKRKLLKEAAFDLSMYEININDPFDISILPVIGNCGQIGLYLIMSDGSLLDLLIVNEVKSCKTEVY